MCLGLASRLYVSLDGLGVRRGLGLRRAFDADVVDDERFDFAFLRFDLFDLRDIDADLLDDDWSGRVNFGGGSRCWRARGLARAEHTSQRVGVGPVPAPVHPGAMGTSRARSVVRFVVHGRGRCSCGSLPPLLLLH